MRRLAAMLCAAALAAACRGAAPAPAPAPAPDMNSIAERYVKLVLAVGQHDADYVDAYYGDPSWKPSGPPASLVDLAAAAGDLRRQIAAVVVDANADALTRLRKDYLERQIASVMSRISMLSGTKYTFDEESTRLYDAEAPHQTEQTFQATRDEIAKLLPGSGSLADRYAAFRKAYVIPSDRLDRVFRAAVDGCRGRTLEHLTLPAGETFTIEYVQGKSWSAYNWYKGNFTSVIQVNTDLPITIDRAIDLACHEGYPGHHVYNVLLEKNLVKDRGWIEYTVYPLFSPQSLIAEGTANYGIEMAFALPD